MPYPPDPRIQHVLQRLRGFRKAQDAGDLDAATHELAKARADAARLGIASAYLLYAQADLALARGEPEEALAAACEAALLEPMHPAIQEQFVKSCQAVRERLLEVEDPIDVRRLHALLSRLGETDVSCHVALARALHAAGAVSDATALVEALVLLAPSSADVWRTQAVFAEARGDLEAAARGRAEASCRNDGSQPYGIPSPRERC